MKGSYERQRKARDEETNPASKGKKPTSDQVSTKLCACVLSAVEIW